MTGKSLQVRLFRFARLTEMIRDVESDDRAGQIAAARASLALRRARLGSRVLVVAVITACGALVWTLVAESPWVSPWVAGAVLMICLVAIGSLIRVRGRWERLVVAADSDIGVPILTERSSDAALTLDLLGLYLSGALKVADLPEPIAVQSQLATIYSPMVNLSGRFRAALHRVREAWATGDERRWLAENARLAELCAEISSLAKLINAQIRDVGAQERP